MASGNYLELYDSAGDPILGESEARGHEEHIDISGWDWSVTDNSSKKSGASTATKGSSTATSKGSPSTDEVGVVPSLFTFNKPVDSATTRLMRAMYIAEKLEKAIFTVREELPELRDESPNAFRLYVTLKNVTIVSYKLNGRAAEHSVSLDETWGLDYENIEFLYATVGGARSEFERPAGSAKKGSDKAVPDPLQLLKKYNELDQIVKAKGKGG